jgi:phosphomannomutase
MNTAPEIFKAYDIRGVVPDQLDPDGAERIGRAFVALVKPETVIVGRDMRNSGPEIHPAVVRGLTAAGANVVDIGLVSTDEYYYACATKDLPGMMVTASHNPPQYNGFKMVRRMPNFVSGTELGEAIKTASFADADTPGTVSETDLHEEFLQKLLSLVDVSSFKPLKVVVDSGNGMTGPVWEHLAGRLGAVEVITQFTDLDGSFPNRGPDPLQMENQAKLRERVLAEKADMGFIFDTDGDRFFLVDDRGESIPGDFLTAILAIQELRKHGPAAVVYDVRASDAVPDAITEAGGRPVVSKVGHANIKPLMDREQAVFGGEISGHLYYGEFWNADSGVLPALKILEYASALQGPLSEAISTFEQKYHLSGEINSTVADQAAVIANLKEKYADGEISELDGVSVRFPDWHFNVRSSNTEPLIRLNLEARTREAMEAKRNELLALIRS